ncbi:probable indole-3-pyruvate monooxygenase YUCCA1 isoform X1 [Eutrema salsugineum]|uniref:probable indole-3-pyruvate monooxygenase YUCCA1 isoform X1 n=1 Tax=Eutrema salsugineum TaxID=72664 RepID=UPI000CED0F9B|nr:probable indole-3-pyruvate monooxygenase YUCCA1 isoform X1 [Eutrema salsugineum]
MESHPHHQTDHQTKQIILVHGPIIIGAGPSGLATSACLSSRGVPSLILERSDSIASLWKSKTYDRLKLHLPKHFCRLPLLDFPENFPKYPSKNEFLDYLESYASHFRIVPRFNENVQHAAFDSSSGLWRVKTLNKTEFLSKWLIVATGENADAYVPEIPGIVKFSGGKIVHASEYKSGEDFRQQKVLVVGCGNSGMEISLDLVRHDASPHLVVRNTVHVLPREIFGLSTFGVGMTLLKCLPLRLVDKFLLLMANLSFGNTDQLGLRRPKTGPLELKNVTGKSPVLDVGAMSLIRCGKIQVSIMEGVKEITKDGAKFMDGQEKDFDSIIFATGYKSNVPTWLQGSECFTKEGMPKTPFPNGWRGGKGLYTVGFTRRGLLGTASDAVKIAGEIADQWKDEIKGPTKKNMCSSHFVLISKS